MHLWSGFLRSRFRGAPRGFRGGDRLLGFTFNALYGFLMLLVNSFCFFIHSCS